LDRRRRRLYHFSQPVVPIGVSSPDVYIDSIVRCNLKFVIGAGAILLAGTRLPAIVPDVSSSQYQGISERNVFGLRPPPTQPSPTNTPVALPKIVLTGITTILDSKRALMKVAPANGKQVEPGKELSLILTEGQREGEIEVLQIDEKAGSVKVNNSGTVMVLTFEKDGAKLPATAPVPGIPGTVPIPGALPAMNPLSFPVRGNSTNFPGRGRGFTPPPMPGVAGATGAAAVPTGGIPTPTGAVAAPAQSISPALSQDLTAEEQAIVMELQRQANPNNAALIPPTPLTPSPGASQPPESSAAGTTTVPTAPGRPLVLVPQ
jgi:hypothetical protein